MSHVKTYLGEGGRIVIPADYRKALGLKPGDAVVLVLDENEVRLVTPRQAAKRAQALVRRHVPGGRVLSDELILDRQREAQLERKKPAVATRRS